MEVLRHEFILIFLLMSFMGWSAAKSVFMAVEENLGI